MFYNIGLNFLDPELKNKKEIEEIKFVVRPNNKFVLEKDKEIDESKKKKKCCWNLFEKKCV